jgi:hypothetical protein
MTKPARRRLIPKEVLLVDGLENRRDRSYGFRPGRGQHDALDAKARLSWEKFIRLVARFSIRTLHPWPSHRFDAKTRGGSPVR